tara:strand:- start:202 stop:1368 length:1167 start_codon:yes stop_codon:yes gene_type:complete
MSNLSRMPAIVEYRNMLKGAPQKLVSKFTIHYNLILNLLRSSTIDTLTFMDRSMNQDAIVNQIKDIKEDIRLTQVEIDSFIPYYKLTVTEDILHTYTEMEKVSQYQSNKQRKHQQKQLQRMRNMYSTLEKDVELYHKMQDYKDKMSMLTRNIEFVSTYNNETIHIFMDILLTHQYITVVNKSNNKVVQFKEDKPWANKDNLVELTEKGHVCIGIQEWNGVVAADFLQDTNYIEELTVLDIIKLFSCFTNIRVSDDVKNGYKNRKYTGVQLTRYLDVLDMIYNKYNDIEVKYELNTGLEYEIHYDLIPYMEEWVLAEDENTCAKVLKKLEVEKGIFVGEFVKALLKIQTICLELEKIADDTNHMDLYIKLREIPERILKYVVTTQSLYI